MQVIHFTAGATDPIDNFDALGIRYVPLAAGERDTDATVSCFHLAPGSQIDEIPCVQDSTLLVVYGHLTLWEGSDYRGRIDMSAGMGVVLSAGEPVRLESDRQAIVIAVESPRLKATTRGLSTPHRVSNQYWPTERLPRRTPISAFRIRYYRSKWRWQFVLRRLRGRLAHRRSRWLRAGLNPD